MNGKEEEEKEVILVVEDSEYLNNYISKHLRQQNYEVVQCFTVDEAYKALSNYFISLVILDLNLGEGYGMDILHAIRNQNKVLPVMIVSSLQDDKTKIEGFKEGCDDYITKPFYIDELMLRVKRMLSKLELMHFEKKKVSQVYTAGIFEIDLDSRTLTKKGNPIQLRKKQFDLMVYFIQHPNVILSFQAIYENVWNKAIPDEMSLESNMYVNIRALRLAIEEDRNNPQHIVSVSKSGYIFVPE